MCFLSRIDSSHQVPHTDSNPLKHSCGRFSLTLSRCTTFVSNVLGLSTAESTMATSHRWSQRRAGEIALGALMLITGIALIALGLRAPSNLVMGALLILTGIGGICYGEPTNHPTFFFHP